MSCNPKVAAVKKFRKAFDACVAHENALNCLLDSVKGPELSSRFNSWLSKKEDLCKNLAEAFCDYRLTLFGDTESIRILYTCMTPNSFIEQELTKAETLINGDVK